MCATPWRPGCFRALSVAVLVTLAAVGCGNAQTAGPTGVPEDVVTMAPDVTLAHGTASIRINSPVAEASGSVDLMSRSGHMRVTDTSITTPADLVIVGGAGYLERSTGAGYVAVGGAVPAVLAGGDPFADLDLIRGTVHILSDGGAEVDGASAIRYTLTVDPGQATSTTPSARQDALRQALQGRTALFQMDVWIDAGLLVRRVEVSTDLRPTTPATRVDRLPVATDVDYLSFGVAVAPETPPPTVGG